MQTKFEKRRRRVWKDMITRCTNEEYKIKRPAYKDAMVCDRWLVFDNFKEDIKEIAGYNEWKNSIIPREYHLDKDLLIKGNKLYSKETCQFILGSINISAAGVTGKTYIGTRLKDGAEFEFKNMRKFCKEIARELNHQNVSFSITNNKDYKGWRFKVKYEN